MRGRRWLPFMALLVVLGAVAVAVTWRSERGPGRPAVEIRDGALATAEPARDSVSATATPGTPEAGGTPAPVRTATPVAQPPDETKLHVVRAAYDLLLDLFVRPLEPNRVLTAGWSGVAQAGQRAGRPAPPGLGQLPGGRDEAFAEFSRAYREYVAKLPEGVSPNDIAFAAVEGMARHAQERHTAFLSPESYRRFLSALGGSEMPVGSGIRLSLRPPFFVTAVASNGPAARAGVMPGDTILTVDGRDIARLSGQDFQATLLGGAAGTTLTLGVDRGGRRLDLTITRGPYYFAPLESWMLPDGVGYLRLEQFTQSGSPLPDGTELLSELDRRLDELDAQGARALVLDLRGNSGGSVLTMWELLGRFLPEDTLTMLFSDQRGHQTTGIVSGLMRPVQHPMVVLVDGGSASASEATAATLKEADRAVIVGQRTAGALSSSLILPLPEGAALQVGVSEILTARNRTKIDMAGFPVDIQVADTRMAADYRVGRDPQLEGAVAALARAPAPPAFRSTTTGVSTERLRALLSPYMPEAGRIPTNDRLTKVVRTGSRAVNHPNQALGSGNRDPLAMQQAIRRRGWLGGYSQGYGVDVLVPPGLGVTINLFATAAGAAEAVSTNDGPELQEAIPPPVQLGDQTAAYRGIWRAQGSTSLIWRRGNVVVTVDYGDAPGNERIDTLVAVAKLVDDALARNPPAP